MRSVAPEPTPTIAITAATPMMMPSIVSAERMRFTLSARSAIRLLATILFMTVSLLRLLNRYQLQILGGIAWMVEALIELEPSVLKMDIPVAVGGDFGIMRHHDDGDSLFAIQLLEDRDDFQTCPGIQRTCRFVCENDTGIVDEGARD